MFLSLYLWLSIWSHNVHGKPWFWIPWSISDQGLMQKCSVTLLETHSSFPLVQFRLHRRTSRIFSPSLTQLRWEKALWMDVTLFLLSLYVSTCFYKFWPCFGSDYLLNHTVFEQISDLRLIYWGAFWLFQLLSIQVCSSACLHRYFCIHGESSKCHFFPPVR